MSIRRLPQATRELTISEMLADPIVQALMASDGATREEVWNLIGAVRANLAKAKVRTCKEPWTPYGMGAADTQTPLGNPSS